jgi:probable F420-dependent oxidoreductase
MRLGLSVCPEAGRWHDTVEQAQLAAELGFDSVWLPEHHLMAGYIPSPMLGLAGLIACTGQMLLGTYIAVAPFYHPVRLAEDAALLQDMSGGRFILGVGLGYRESEFDAFGIPYQERAGRLAETLEIVRQLMSAERVTFRGRYFNLTEVTIHPRPAVPPPLWVGGWSRTAVRRAAELGDAWFPGPTADVPKVAGSLRWYDEALAERGQRRHELPIFRELWVADSDELMAAGVEPMRRLYSDDYLTWGHANLDAGRLDPPGRAQPAAAAYCGAQPCPAVHHP